MNYIIKGKNIRKNFVNGNEQTNVLNEINIDIEKGDFVAIMGPSGSGKSTLLYTLSGMDGITSGTVEFDAIELSKLHEKDLADIRRKKMGFIFQQPTMLKNLNLLDNIILPAINGHTKNVVSLTKKAKELMKKTGISDLETRNITEVSGGQLQRAGICRALMNDPQIIFADEPTGALNSKSAKEIMELLVEINKEGTAILLVTHDAKVAANANRVLFTKDGKIVKELSLKMYTDMGEEMRVDKIITQMAIIGI